MTDHWKTILRSAAAFLILLAPNLYACLVASDLASPAKAIAYLLVVCIGLALPMLFLRRRAYFIVIGILNLFCAPIEIASLYLNHNPATATFLGLFFSTNRQEVAGILSVIWPLLILLVLIWIGYFVLVWFQPNEWIIPRKTGLRIAGIGLPILFVCAISFFSLYARKIYNLQNTKEVVLFAKDLTLMKFYKIFPYNIYLNSWHIAQQRHAMKEAQAALGPFRFGLTAKQDSIPELYILVIGEAARSENMSINGYARSTTPRLEQRSRLVSFPHFYSQAGTTEQAVPHMLSRIPATLHHEVNSEKTLPEAFQEAGFRTAWLTNKSRADYLQRVLESADVRFETGKDMNVTNNYDEYLLQPLQDLLVSGVKKQFIVVHTMGSHWRYDTRYPAPFEQFTPALGESFSLSMINPSNKQKLVNAYDNTILYTDYFLDSLITLVEAQAVPALVMYMSDHGENLYDDERELILHGNYSATRWLFHVPFFVWYSDEYAASHPDKIQQLQAHADSRDNSSVLFVSLLDAADIGYINDTTSAAQLRTRSIFSADYSVPDTLYVLTAEEKCVVLEQD